MQTISSHAASSAITDTLSIRNGSVIGLVFAATKTKESIFATAGLIKLFFLSKTFSIYPFLLPSTAKLTLSPTKGDVPSSLNFPLALHS